MPRADDPALTAARGVAALWVFVYHVWLSVGPQRLLVPFAGTTLDLTPPAISETTPGTSATGVAITTTVRVRYSEIIDPTKFVGPAITVTGPSGALDGRIDVILGNTTVVFTPQFPLLEDATYQVQVAPATDLTGRQQAAGLTFAFSTTDRTPPAITALAPSRPTVIENTIVDVAATASVSDVAFVDFFVNDTLAFTSRTTPFTMALQASPQFCPLDKGLTPVGRE